MPSELYWIDAAQAARLAIMARPRAGDWLEDEIAHWKSSGVETVVSLLQPEELYELGLQSEEALCRDAGIEYLSFPIPDRGVPDDINETMRFAARIAVSGRSTAIHCRAGIGRSSIMAAAILIRIGVRADVALSAIEKARGLMIPDTRFQREWIFQLERT